MKEVHLICNAHLDPIWQWEWEEGAAAALSTFRSAADHPVDVSTKKPAFTLKIEDTDIVLVTMKKAQECEGYILRLLNNDAKSRQTKVCCGGAEIALTFGRYEVKSLLYQNNQLIEQDRLMI